jgi:class 3 adenylate cyclase
MPWTPNGMQRPSGDAIRAGLLRAASTASGGQEVKNLGDGLMVAFSSLSRAPACAVAMQQAVLLLEPELSVSHRSLLARPDQLRQ